MDNKKLGFVLIGICVIFGFLVFMFNDALNEHAEGSCECEAMLDGGACPMDSEVPWQTYLGIILVAGLAALGLYLVFFERSQVAIMSALENHNKEQSGEERFRLLLKGLDNEEKKVVKAVKEQDGITQQTLRLRTDLHKSKLSILLDRLEKKGLVKRVVKGKTKQVFLRVKL
jgi:ribosomal protein S25